MAHARRKFEELRDTERSDLASEALLFDGSLHDIESKAREGPLHAAAVSACDSSTPVR